MHRILLTAALSGILFISLGFAQPFPNAKTIIEQVSPSIVMVTRHLPEKKVSICTGFVINAATKHVLTASHCVKDDKLSGPNTPISVDTLHAIVVKTDEWLALLVVPQLNKPALALEKTPVMIGDFTYALGFGEGISTILLRPVIWIFHKGKVYQDGIVVDGIFIQGMSGGPVVSLNGRVIGMVQKGDEVMGYASGPGAIKAFLK